MHVEVGLLEVVAGGGLDIWRGRGCVPHMTEYLGIEGRAHLMPDLATPLGREHSSLLYAVIHQDLQSRHLSLDQQEREIYIIHCVYIYMALCSRWGLTSHCYYRHICLFSTSFFV